MRDETGHHLSVISSESVQIFTDRIFRIALLLVKESEQRIHQVLKDVVSWQMQKLMPHVPLSSVMLICH